MAGLRVGRDGAERDLRAAVSRARPEAADIRRQWCRPRQPLGGSDPDRTLRWSHDGRELFYWDGDRLLSVPVAANREFSSGSPRAVFELADVLDADVAPDGQRFLVAREMAAARLGQIVVALGGAASIGTRTP